MAHVQGGRVPVLNMVIDPLIGVKEPLLPFYFGRYGGPIAALIIVY